MVHKPNNVLAAAEANRIWSLYGLNHPEDLLLDDLAFSKGILVFDDQLDSSAARLIRRKDKGIIRVSTDVREPGRRRFAIAHEIGHFLLHEKTTQILVCTEKDLRQSYKNSPAEIEASTFAANLLMPEHLFKPQVEHAPPTKKLLEHLAAEFMTSLTATAVRCVELSDDYCIVVVSEAGRVKWWRASPSFEQHELWLDTKNVLPTQSLAAAIFRGEAAPTRPEEVDFSAWLGEVEGIDADSIVEQAIPLTGYGQVLSVLWLT